MISLDITSSNFPLTQQLVVGGCTGARALGACELDSSDSVSKLQTPITPIHSIPLEQLAELRKERRFFHCDPVAFQLRGLKEWSVKLREELDGRAVSIGLSGGYDSRLLLLLCIAAGIQVSLFSYVSPNHEKEFSIAQAVAKKVGIELRPIVVRHWRELEPQALDENISDAIQTWDGETNDTMGSFNDAHTARTWRECRGDAWANINGLGGELYRNRERIGCLPGSWLHFVKHFILPHGVEQLFTSPKYATSFIDQLMKEFSIALGEVAPRKYVTRSSFRKWYRDVRLRWWESARLRAENRVGPAFMPFADNELSMRALLAGSAIGSHGHFEGSMLGRLNSEIAAMPSVYGHGLGPTRPVKRLSDFILSLTPYAVRRWRAARRISKTQVARPLEGWHRDRFASSLRLLREASDGLDIDAFLSHPATIDRTLFIAETLLMQARSAK